MNVRDATRQAREGVYPSNSQRSFDNQKRRGGILDILFTCSVISFPFVALSAALLGVIFKYRIKHTNPSDDEPGVYYVRINATTLVLLASFSSSVAPLLISFFMNLLSYPISRRIIKLSEQERPRSLLPTPYQFTLIIALLRVALERCGDG